MRVIHIIGSATLIVWWIIIITLWWRRPRQIFPGVEQLSSNSGSDAPPAFLDVDWVLAAFGRRKSKALEGYRQFVSEGKGQPSPWQALRNHMYLGNNRFVDKMLDTQEGDKDLSEIPKSQRRPKPLSIARSKGDWRLLRTSLCKS